MNVSCEIVSKKFEVEIVLEIGGVYFRDKIEAIKKVRELRSLGLKEAMDLTEFMIDVALAEKGIHPSRVSTANMLTSHMHGYGAVQRKET